MVHGAAIHLLNGVVAEALVMPLTVVQVTLPGVYLSDGGGGDDRDLDYSP